jgi:hypothetical protein
MDTQLFERADSINSVDEYLQTLRSLNLTQAHRQRWAKRKEGATRVYSVNVGCSCKRDCCGHITHVEFIIEAKVHRNL